MEAIDRIEITVDGGPPEPARPAGMVRPDVVAHTGDPADQLAGFWHLLDLGDRPPGSACTLRAEAVGPTGRRLLGERRVVVDAVPSQLDEHDRGWVAALAERATRAAAVHVPGDGLRLAVVTHDLRLGGAQLWLQEILRTLVDDPEVSCTVFAQFDGELRRELEAAGVAVHLAGPFPETAAAYESAVRELVSLVVEDGASVVLANTASAYLGVDVALRCDLPSVYAIHDHFPQKVLWYRGPDVHVDEHVRERARVALEQATLTCFVADATRRLYLPDEEGDRSLRLDYGVDLAVVDRDLDTLDRDRLRRQHGYRPEDTVLVSVAAVSARKAGGSLVLAVRRLLDDHPGLRLALVGSTDDPYCREVAALAEAVGLGDRVRLVPLTADVASWYVLADGFVLPSDSESLPRAIIEAMAYRVPVVATDVGGVGELVEDGVTGLLVAPRDVGALADAVRRLLALDDAGRRALVDTAQARVRDRYDAGRYTAAFGRLLRGLAKDPEAPVRAWLDEPDPAVDPGPAD